MLLPSIVLGLPGGWLADRLGPARGLALGASFRLSAVALGIVLLDGGTSAWLLACEAQGVRWIAFGTRDALSLARVGPDDVVSTPLADS